MSDSHNFYNMILKILGRGGSMKKKRKAPDAQPNQPQQVEHNNGYQLNDRNNI